MATQQAWDDFNNLKSKISYLEGIIAVIKDDITKLETAINLITADPVRTAEAAALADQHPVWTTAEILDSYGKLLNVRTAVIANGY